MKVSVIIPTYNEEGVIDDCLASLSKQSFKDMELIVVDDGSSDKTMSVLSEFRISNFEFRILTQNHKGAGAARNLGAGYAKSEILVFVDADMNFDRDFVKNLVKPIIEDGMVGTFSKEEYLLNKDNVWAKCWNINRGLPTNKMHSENYPNKQKVFRAILRKEYNRVGGFDEKAGYTDDWSLSEKLGIEAVAAPGADFYHKNPGSLSEVFTQSRWMAKRKYKFGLLGNLVALLRVSLPSSIVLGFVKALQSNLQEFLLFKIVSDFGFFLGILEFSILGKTYK